MPPASMDNESIASSDFASDGEDGEGMSAGFSVSDSDEGDAPSVDPTGAGGVAQKKGEGPWRLELNSNLASQAHRLALKEQKRARGEKEGTLRLTAPEQSPESQRKKGQQIQKQQGIIADLLALRIRLNGALRGCNRLPNAHMFALLSEFMGNARKDLKQTREREQGATANEDSSSPSAGTVSTSLSVSLNGLREEAAGLVEDLLALQGALLEQNGFRADFEEEDEEEDDAAAVAAERSGAEHEDSWERRRLRWRQAQRSLRHRRTDDAEAEDAEASRGKEGGGSKKRKAAAVLSSDEEDAFTDADEAKTPVELSVWTDTVDAFWRRKARRLCLENADAWHATVDPRSQSFRSMSQPPSQQLHHAMTTQYSRLLTRALRSAHIPLSATASATARSAAPDPTSRHGESGSSSEGCVPCHVVGCSTLQKLVHRSGEGEREAAGTASILADLLRHDFYDDGDFYVELLKQVVKQGGALDSSDTLDKEKSLLKLRNKLNRNRTDVDRRASKGRKIRYQPIEKLQNLVAAIPWQPNVDALPGAGDETMVNRLMRQLFADD
ncbi:hypothetical protein BESB_073750 [Besnoitia besnoiti]|uniref:Apoptosis antagonizing transcription factor n=1 Tax=Besnoitia besnoiti TaxID=94643 RepID=A0A2A9MEX5_BESBE|nr:uncharacterized protein BESB_073750 [Besnoitia besnoiti]PFH34223.1 hypothetical protein BESB_073750 [Besnoitia besnoiti]